MIVNVAGAGAGKTTKMADIIMSHDIPDGMVVFCIAFTNAAADNIIEKVARKKGGVPNSIRISTIHSFLYQELIEPYYYFLYGKHYKHLSSISLPSNSAYKASKLSELENSDILHITKIPEKAKWVVSQKSSDSKTIKEIRAKVLAHFNSYCAAIYVDEAQDISNDIFTILTALEDTGVEIILYGDPKQDVKGFGCFRRIIDNTPGVCYLSECYRCPQSHLNLSNRLANDNEKQIADHKNGAGCLEIIYESEIKDVKKHIGTEKYGLCYISQKNERFYTHGVKEIDDRFDALRYEVYRAMEEKWRDQKTTIEIERAAFFVTEKMLENYDQTGNAAIQISNWIKKNAFNQLESRRYAQMISAFQMIQPESNDAIVVKSIEIIKGLESDNCLFILTTDLAPYLFGTRTEDNKTKHLLYVALTRSHNKLTIMVTKEVENQYSHDNVVDYFSLAKQS